MHFRFYCYQHVVNLSIAGHSTYGECPGFKYNNLNRNSSVPDSNIPITPLSIECVASSEDTTNSSSSISNGNGDGDGDGNDNRSANTPLSFMLGLSLHLLSRRQSNRTGHKVLFPPP
ncbi:hypothetical protein ACLKA7_007031 [Drosophila subpalustris]